MAIRSQNSKNLCFFYYQLQYKTNRTKQNRTYLRPWSNRSFFRRRFSSLIFLLQVETFHCLPLSKLFPSKRWGYFSSKPALAATIVVSKKREFISLVSVLRMRCFAASCIKDRAGLHSSANTFLKRLFLGNIALSSVMNRSGLFLHPRSIIPPPRWWFVACINIGRKKSD